MRRSRLHLQPILHNPPDMAAVPRGSLTMVVGSVGAGCLLSIVLSASHSLLLFTVPRGSLTMVVGSVGAGKSSLLAALLAEMATLNGSVVVRGTTAYTQQDSWIQVGG